MGIWMSPENTCVRDRCINLIRNNLRKTRGPMEKERDLRFIDHMEQVSGVKYLILLYGFVRKQNCL